MLDLVQSGMYWAGAGENACSGHCLSTLACDGRLRSLRWDRWQWLGGTGAALMN